MTPSQQATATPTPPRNSPMPSQLMIFAPTMTLLNGCSTIDWCYSTAIYQHITKIDKLQNQLQQLYQLADQLLMLLLNALATFLLPYHIQQSAPPLPAPQPWLFKRYPNSYGSSSTTPHSYPSLDNCPSHDIPYFCCCSHHLLHCSCVMLCIVAFLHSAMLLAFVALHCVALRHIALCCTPLRHASLALHSSCSAFHLCCVVSHMHGIMLQCTLMQGIAPLMLLLLLAFCSWVVDLVKYAMVPESLLLKLNTDM